jgi:uncharacterized protein (TIGR02118 family)
MIRRLTLVRRRPEFGREEFADHWLGLHAKIAAQLPGLRGYRINLSVQTDPPPRWDGVAELWFDSIEAGRTAMGEGPVAERLRHDTRKLLAEWEPFFLEEHVIVPPPEAPLDRAPRAGCRVSVSWETRPGG